MRKFVFPIAITGLLVVATSAAAGGSSNGHLKGQELAALTKVSLAQARTIALKSRPGRITDEELERERGGTGLRYSFDVKSGGATFEVGVDARTGKVLENKKEGPSPD